VSRLGAGWAAASAVVTAAWVVVAWNQGDAAPVATDAVGAAAAAATAALVGAGWRPSVPAAARLSAPVLLVLPVAVAGAGAGHPGLLVVALGLAGLAVRPAALAGPARGDGGRPRRGQEWTPLLVAAGCDLVAVAILLERLASERWVLPGPDATARGMALTGAALLVVAAVRGPARAWALACPALVVAVVAAAHLPESTGVVLAGAAALAAALLVHRPAAALAALAVAAAVVDPTVPAARLLAAAAVLSLVLEHRAAVVVALPGASALAAGLVAVEPAGPVVALSVAAGATALALGAAAAGTPLVAGPKHGRLRGPNGIRPAVEAVPALALSGWLLLAPSTWTWAGRAGLDGYDRGAAVALAAAALAATGVEVARARRPRRGGPAHRRRRPAPPAVVVDEQAGPPLPSAGPVVVHPPRPAPAPPAGARPGQDGGG
jgi:hypothetical protein